MIDVEEHLKRAAGCESVTLPAAMWMDALWELQSRRSDEMVAIGPFYLKRYDEHSFWLGHESGEGMQVRNHRVLDVFNELWKEF
jgi:hypothetical protein